MSKKNEMIIKVRAKFFVRVYTSQPKNILEKSIQAVTERYHECLVDEDAMREIQKEVVSRIEQYKGRARAHQLVPFEAPELSSVGWTMTFSRDGIDSLSAKPIR